MFSWHLITIVTAYDQIVDLQAQLQVAPSLPLFPSTLHLTSQKWQKHPHNLLSLLVLDSLSHAWKNTA